MGSGGVCRDRVGQGGVGQGGLVRMGGRVDLVGLSQDGEGRAGSGPPS